MPAARMTSAERKSGKEASAGGGQEEERSGGHDDEADDHGLLVADALDELATGVTEDKIRGEEEEGDGLGFGVVQAEDRFEVRADDIVEAREETDHEEEGGSDAHSAHVGFDLPIG
jgi:hypothetical protein